MVHAWSINLMGIYTLHTGMQSSGTSFQYLCWCVREGNVVIPYREVLVSQARPFFRNSARLGRALFLKKGLACETNSIQWLRGSKSSLCMRRPPTLYAYDIAMKSVNRCFNWLLDVLI